MKKAILVAGATGNLGKRICRELIKRDADVSAIVRTSTDLEKTNPLLKMGVKVIEADLNSLDGIAKACKGYTLRGFRAGGTRRCNCGCTEKDFGWCHPSRRSAIYYIRLLH